MIGNATSKIRDCMLAEPGRKWLILGKGPTSDLVGRLTLSDYFVVTLNHACKLVRSTFAHFTDLEAFDDCCDHVKTSADAVIMPWHPHLGMKPSLMTLSDYTRPSAGSGYRPALAWFATGDRLFSYNSSLAHKLERCDKFPTIRVRYFSAVAAFNLLAYAGVRHVYSLGVDGGTAYGKAFDRKDRLANGRESFDIQFREIALTCKHTGVVYTNLAATPLHQEGDV